MRVAILGDYLLEWREQDRFDDSETFLDAIYERRYDVAVVMFGYYQEIKDIRHFYEGIVIFIDSYYDSLHLKRALEIGDYYFLHNEYERILMQLHYLQKRIYGERILRVGDLFFDRVSGRCFKGRKEFHLTPAQKSLLQLLACNRPVSFDEIFASTEISNKESLKVVVAGLRKLGFDIESVKNYGYQLQREKK